MNIEKVKSIFLYLTTKLFIFVAYIILMLTLFFTFYFLNYKGIKFFSGIIIITLIALITIGLINGFKAIKAKRRPKIYLLSLNLVSLLIFSCTTYVLTDFYVEGNENIKLFDVISEEKFDELSSKFTEHKYKNVTLHHNDLDKETLSKVEKIINLALTKASNTYSTLVLDDNINVFLHSKPDDFSNSLDRDSIGGYFSVYDKSINIPLFNTPDIDKRFEKTFTHEFNHYTVDKIRGLNNIDVEALPAWFAEGASEYLAYGDTTSNPILHLIDFDKLFDLNGWQFINVKQGYNSYPQSHYAICYLVQKAGIDSIEKIILGTKDSNFEKSFEKVIGMPVKSFLDECEKVLIKEFSIHDVNVIK